jgi:hypothetical protein
MLIVCLCQQKRLMATEVNAEANEQRNKQMWKAISTAKSGQQQKSDK